MNDQYLIKATYGDHTVEVWPIETHREGKAVGYVFDILINEAYWGTCFTLEKVQESLTLLRTQIEKGENIWAD